jgi:hypothetical protein
MVARHGDTLLQSKEEEGPQRLWQQTFEINQCMFRGEEMAAPLVDYQAIGW